MIIYNMHNTQTNMITVNSRFEPHETYHTQSRPQGSQAPGMH